MLYSILKKHFLIVFVCSIMSQAYGQIPDSLFIYVHKGSFHLGNMKGDNDEMPQKRVSVSDFFISKYEVTNVQYSAAPYQLT